MSPLPLLSQAKSLAVQIRRQSLRGIATRPKPRTRTQAASSPVWHPVSYPASSSPQEMSEISSDRKSGYFPEFHGTEVWVPVPSSRSHLGPVLWTGLGPPGKPGVRGAKVDPAP